MLVPLRALLALAAASAVAVPSAFGQGQTPPPGNTPRPVPLPGRTPGATLPPGNTGGGNASAGLGALPVLPASAYARVLVFRADADGYDSGRLSITVRRITGLTKALKEDFNDAVDEQDGIVLVGKTVKVVDRKGRKLKHSALDDADSVSVTGKLLRPSQWKDDEDGNPVPTIRAKRITVVG